MKNILIALCFGAALFAQTKPVDVPKPAEKVEPAKPPVVPAEVEAEYYRADSVVAHMEPGYNAAMADRQAAAAAVVKACGDKFMPNQEGKHIVCQVKPEPAKTDAKK